LANGNFTYKFGKNPRRLDRRTIRLSKILPGLAPVPGSWDGETALHTSNPSLAFPGRMWMNNICGDCVLAARANQQRIFSAYEEARIIPITDTNVRSEYFAESGGADSGLVMLDSLNCWRKGWKLGAVGCWHKSVKRDIYAYAAISGVQELLQSIYYLGGAYIGIQVPQYAIDQFNAGYDWDLSEKGDQTIVGGHCIQLPAYISESQLLCWTWGIRQRMSVEFYNKYCDESYGIIQGRDIANSPVDITKLDAYLQEITSEGSKA
jgi:hypothetical protein